MKIFIPNIYYTVILKHYRSLIIMSGNYRLNYYELRMNSYDLNDIINDLCKRSIPFIISVDKKRTLYKFYSSEPIITVLENDDSDLCVTNLTDYEIEQIRIHELLDKL